MRIFRACVILGAILCAGCATSNDRPKERPDSEGREDSFIDRIVNSAKVSYDDSTLTPEKAAMPNYEPTLKKTQQQEIVKPQPKPSPVQPKPAEPIKPVKMPEECPPPLAESQMVIDRAEYERLKQIENAFVEMKKLSEKVQTR